MFVYKKHVVQNKLSKVRSEFAAQVPSLAGMEFARRVRSEFATCKRTVKFDSTDVLVKPRVWNFVDVVCEVLVYKIIVKGDKTMVSCN
uniref:Uncharacterized protein n=1 Tax=Anopheles atroparvus TaxID=41427 RepID=A0AAG5DNS2_ANOAO